LKKFHWMILRALPGPFLTSLFTLIFLILLQFLMRYLPELVGKGLDFTIILEIIAYNLAYMVVLSVPMSVLLSTIYVFARLVQSGGFMVIKGAGVSLMQIAWPVVIVGLLVAGSMTYFNNYLLPEANYRAKNLWQDIRQKKPTFGLEEGVFNNDLKGYAIRAFGIDEEGTNLKDVTVVDQNDRQGKKTTLMAERGRMITLANRGQLQLTLEDGEIHRKGQNKDTKYERIRFQRHVMYLDISDLSFQRSDDESASRSDRTTPTPVMSLMVDSLENRARTLQDDIFLHMKSQAKDLMTAESPTETLDRTFQDQLKGDQKSEKLIAGRMASVSDSSQAKLDHIEKASVSIRRIKAELANASSSVKWTQARADRYRVEIYKKYSLALACFVFMLIGIPLGLMIKKGGIDKVAILSIAIFLFYWITLVIGEKRADRGDLDPWLGMWIANIVIGVAAVYLLMRVGFDWKWKGKKGTSVAKNYQAE